MCGGRGGEREGESDEGGGGAERTSFATSNHLNEGRGVCVYVGRGRGVRVCESLCGRGERGGVRGEG